MQILINVIQLTVTISNHKVAIHHMQLSYALVHSNVLGKYISHWNLYLF